jgi:hypothetical protein
MTVKFIQLFSEDIYKNDDIFKRYCQHQVKLLASVNLSISQAQKFRTKSDIF